MRKQTKKTVWAVIFFAAIAVILGIMTYGTKCQCVNYISAFCWPIYGLGTCLMIMHTNGHGKIWDSSAILFLAASIMPTIWTFIPYQWITISCIGTATIASVLWIIGKLKK